MYLEVSRDDIRNTRLVPSENPSALAANSIVLRLDSAALTSNNISYALSGDLLDYWGFFPTEQGWGRLPVMGFGTVVRSANPDIAVGNRYFGFFPLGSHHMVHATVSRSGFIDSSPWREKHATVYKNFDVAQPTNHDDALLIFRGLFLTSFLLEDFLREQGHFGAQQVVITSASSKTSIALAHCLQTFSNLRVIGLTSSRNLSFVENVGDYDGVVTYDRLDAIEKVPSVVVDMAGNASVVAELHSLLSGFVMHSSSVGATHWDAPRGTIHIPDPRPEFFFAPSQVAKRNKDWGREVVNQRMTEALELFIQGSTRWLTIQHTNGADAVERLYGEIVAGRVDPRLGHIVSFNSI